MRGKNMKKLVHKILCCFVKNPAIQTMGLISGIKYSLGIAKECKDFW